MSPYDLADAMQGLHTCAFDSRDRMRKQMQHKQSANGSADHDQQLNGVRING